MLNQIFPAVLISKIIWRKILEQMIAQYFWCMKESFLVSIFQLISSKGYILFTSLIFIGYAAFQLHKKVIFFLITLSIAVGISDALCYRVLKPAIMRERPKVELNISRISKFETSGDFSMPSNHASNIFSFFIVYLIFVRKFWLIFLANSILIALSRVILVKHYPSDILLGIFVGSMVGLCSVYFLPSTGRMIFKKIIAVHR